MQNILQFFWVRWGWTKNLEKKRLGKLLCNYCIGFAENISEHIACRYIILQTNQANIDFYKKSGFQQSVKSNPEGKFWMYRRLSVEIEHVVNDTVGITESVYSKVTPEDNDKKKIND
jgi:hypothetical protein